MHFYLIGIDYKGAPIDARDIIYRNREAISDFWENYDPRGTAVLVTCNRIEIYGVAEYADDALGHIAVFLRNFPDFSKYAHVKLGEAQVFRHALRLGSGLESQLNGEEEILAQINAWRVNSALPLPLQILWDKAVFLSEKIRIESKLNEGSANIAALVFNDIAQRLERKEGYEIAVVGTGKIAEVFAKYRLPGAHLAFAAHKNHKKAQALAKNSGGRALLFQDLPRIIPEADALICATSSPHYVLKKEHFDNYPVRRGHPLYIYDLAIPRDVEPAVGGIEGVYLYNLDTLEPLFSGYNRSLRDRIESASGLIEEAAGMYQEVIHDKNH
jgi:glutamyl-tRNA reductase